MRQIRGPMVKWLHISMKTKPSLFLASTFSALALFLSFAPAHAEDQNQQQDGGKKEVKECHEGSGCGTGVCPWSADKSQQGADKKQQEGEAEKPTAPSSSNE